MYEILVTCLFMVFGFWFCLDFSFDLCFVVMENGIRETLFI